MSFDIRKYVKVPAFLQFAGMVLAISCLFVMHPGGFFGGLAKAVAFIALAAALGGFFKEKINFVVILFCFLLFAAPGLQAKVAYVTPTEPTALTYEFVPPTPAQTAPAHSVALTWDASTSSTATNPGKYILYRAPLLTAADGSKSCGTFVSLGNTGSLTSTDPNVAGATSYCYQVTFQQIPDGQTVAIESLPSTPIVVVVPATIVLSPPTNLRTTKVQ